MPKPIATTSGGIAFAFPNVCMTPVPPPTTQVPIPYPNIGQLSDAGGADTVNAGGSPVITTDSSIDSTTGSEAGSNGNPTSGEFAGNVKFVEGSSTVKVEGASVVRLLDTTSQNNGGAVGKVLGGFPTVLVGG